MDTIEALRHLSDKDVAIFNAEVQRQSKSTGLAYVLWFFVGTFGVHKFYMGRPVWGLIYLLLCGVGYLFFFGGLIASMAAQENDPAGAMQGSGAAAIGLAALILLGLFLLWDLFTIPRQLRQKEEKVKTKLLNQLGETA
jgi:TM2 domain-containing membrane protein YozV